MFTFFFNFKTEKKIPLNTQNKSILLITIKNKSVSYNPVNIILKITSSPN